MNYNPDAQLTRREATDALNANGYRVSPNTLSQYAHLGCGPPFLLFGRRALYRYDGLMAWAAARMRAPVSKPRQRDRQNAA